MSYLDVLKTPQIQHSQSWTPESFSPSLSSSFVLYHSKWNHPLTNTCVKQEFPKQENFWTIREIHCHSLLRLSIHWFFKSPEISFDNRVPRGPTAIDEYRPQGSAHRPVFFSKSSSSALICHAWRKEVFVEAGGPLRYNVAVLADASLPPE